MQEFDKYIKDNLYNHESPVPAGLWERIVPEKDKKKPAPLPFWKNGYFQSTILAIITVGIIGSAYFYTNKSTGENAIKIKELSPLIKLAILNKNATGSATGVITKTKENRSDFTTVETKNNDSKTNTIHSVCTHKSNAQETKLKMYNATTADKGNAQLLADNSFVISQSERINTFTTNKNNRRLLNESENENQKFERGNIVLKSWNLPTDNYVTKTLNDSKNTITTITLPNNTTKNWFVELYASPEYSSKKVGISSSNYFYTQALDTAQKLSAGFTVGIRIAKNLTNHLLLKSGIQFNQINERFRYKQFDTKNSTVLTERSYINNDGATISIKDTSTFIQTGYRLMTSYNTYKCIEIPVIASWEAGNNKWHFAANGGIIANIASFYEGKTFDNNLNTAPLSAKEQNGVLKSAINLSLYGGVSFLYDIGNSFDAFAEPYCKYGLSNSSNTSFGFSQRFNSLGINFGIRYKIPRSSIKL